MFQLCVMKTHIFTSKFKLELVCLQTKITIKMDFISFLM